MKKLMKGNEAMAEAAVQAGCRYYFGYPITPQSEVPEYMSWRLPEVGGVYKQAESELAAANMLFGACAAGGRAMTSSSGLGIALMQEAISHISACEVPAVILNVARGGPAIGSIQPGQADYYQMTRGGGPGDYSMIVYAPGNVQEACDLLQLSFDKAEQYLNPVAVYVDGCIGQLMESVEIKTRERDPNLPPKTWAAVGWDDKSRPKTRYTSVFMDPAKCEAHNNYLQEKFQKIRENETRLQCIDTEDADIVLVAYGTTARICMTAKRIAAQNGIKVGIARPITIWPFPYDGVYAACRNAKAVLCVEMAAGQMLDDVRIALKGAREPGLYYRLGGMLPKARDIYHEIVRMLKEVQ